MGMELYGDEVIFEESENSGKMRSCITLDASTRCCDDSVYIFEYFVIFKM